MFKVKDEREALGFKCDTCVFAKKYLLIPTKVLSLGLMVEVCTNPYVLKCDPNCKEYQDSLK